MNSIRQPVIARARQLLAVLGLMGVLLATPVQAQPVSHPIGLQGLLLGNDGAALSGNYDLTFRLFDAANGGQALWTETQPGVPASDGLYDVALGTNQPLPPDVFTGAPRYLEVSVNGEVLRPRIPLRAVPLADAAKTLADGALQAGSNVSITRQAGGILRIDADGGGGGGGGLSSVATDATISGDGTSGNPLGLAEDAVQGGTNVTVDRTSSGAFVVSSTGGEGGGLMSVASDATLSGNGTSGNPLGLADGAVTGSKIADGALQAGSNVTITRQGDGTLEIEATGGGGGGGLTSVTSDATLLGNGTSSSPLGLANGAVTGAKIADGALQAGSNVTITRQGDGSLEVASSGLSLPFSGSTSSSDPAFSIENTGSGWGINVQNAEWGIQVANTTYDGIIVESAGQIGVTVKSAASTGVRVASAGVHGVGVLSADFHGVAVGSARTGFWMDSAENDGVFVQSAGRFGLNVVNATRGVDINTTSSDGLLVRNAGRHGLLVNDATSNGIQIDQADNDGFQIVRADNDGVAVNSAGRFGLNVVNAVRGVDINTTSSDGLLVRNAGGDGLRVDAAGRDGIRVSSASGLAGNFGGDVQVSGTLSKGGGSFRIDHPLDPANKYLAHSFVESSDMMNVYNGNAVLDAAGEAVVELPAYFEALNRDFRYQLTCIGGFAPVYVAEEIQGNLFRIAGGEPGLKVSWQVTGIRQDAWANEHRIVVEQDKPAAARGYYLHPALHGQPEARNLMRLDAPDDF